MPHSSGYISTGGILALPRGSDSLIPRWWRHCGIIILESVLDIVVSASQIIIKISLPCGSALGLAHRISFGEQVAQGFHKNLRISWHGAGSS